MGAWVCYMSGGIVVTLRRVCSLGDDMATAFAPAEGVIMEFVCEFVNIVCISYMFFA